jgi:hypothetical protein
LATKALLLPEYSQKSAWTKFPKEEAENGPWLSTAGGILRTTVYFFYQVMPPTGTLIPLEGENCRKKISQAILVSGW